ncbi:MULTISPECIES: SDR family NAD(P)-dependent oxidoreductase [unclassified Sinorhizobium]|uniref:SDR family oxidoreductase n=1 Tax=unclassified Sinorhizobium TaxID=2613772 RepID=UPI0024C25717|nr:MULTISPECIES: SDR family NAD(P)-dependent oxidoreductase [unclassified Sinorhizobium]MDK1376510.1 SDR family NAD(P)-dependent oxidoreductase [Sinorhizobium sp. 6-70]MDK1482108.1 SDR family NAD(P)-dependent oxidoreductase [Sinorhizobium sp. 6-117]
MNDMTARSMDRTAIVTGGAKGLGLAIAKRLFEDGCRIALWDINVSSFDEEQADFGPAVKCQVDVADGHAVDAAFHSTLEALGHVDILVNNAGINGPVANTWDYAVEDWDRVLSVDLDSVFYCCRTAIPHMIERGYGRIVNVASIAGKEGNAGGSAYAAAKGGVIAYTKSIAKELAQTGVLVNCIAPAVAETELLREVTPEFIATTKAKIPMGRFVTASEVAATVAFAASSDCSFTTGFTFDVTGGRATY